MLFYHRFLSGYGIVGLVFSFIFLLCGALRLARFNATINKISSYYFQVLPIPLGALSLVGHVLLSLEFQNIMNIPYFSFLYILFYSILMISNIPFYSFKKSDCEKE
jgi:CDP-diacylglycerol--serine O-phosphatidyltransferase